MQRTLPHPSVLSLPFQKGAPPDHYSYARISIEQQIDALCSIWPALKPDHAIRYAARYSELHHPDWVEGPFVLIRAGFFSNKPGEEIEEVLKALASRYKIDNYRKGELGPKHLKRCASSLRCEARIAELQPGDLWIVGGQFGKRYPGESVDDVRAQVEDPDHGWCFGSRDIGCMILTHPDRLVPGTRLHCSGDEYDIHADNDFSRAPCFGLKESQRLTFDTHRILKMYENYGSPTGFISK